MIEERIAHPAAAPLQMTQAASDSLQEAEAVFHAFETLIRCDALALANCALRERLALSEVVRGRLLAPRFHLGDWLALLQALVKSSEGEPFRSLCRWVRSAGPALQRLVTLRNQKAHDERRADAHWVGVLAAEARAVLGACVAEHPPLGPLTTAGPDSVQLSGVEIGGDLFRVDRGTTPPRLALYKGASGGRMRWSFADGAELSDRERLPFFARTIGAQVPAQEVVDLRCEPDLWAGRLEAGSRATIRRLTEMRHYRPEITIDRKEPNSFLVAFVRRAVPLLVVEGPEGAGKSTWFCRITEERLAQGAAVIFETAARLEASPLQSLALNLRLKGDLVGALERLALSSPDERALILIDDVPPPGERGDLFASCLRWAESAGPHGNVRLLLSIRSEHLQTARASGRIAGASGWENYLLPPLVESELIRISQELPGPPGLDLATLRARRRELAQALARQAAATVRRPAFATAFLESCGDAPSCTAWSAHALYGRIVRTDILGTHDAQRPRWPERGRIVAAVARALLSAARPFVPLAEVQARGVALLDPKSGKRLSAYLALLDGGHLTEQFEGFETCVGFANSRLFEHLAAQLLRPSALAPEVVRLLGLAGTFPPAWGIASFLICEAWPGVDAGAVVAAVRAERPAAVGELLVHLGAAAPAPYLEFIREAGKVDLAACFEAISVQIHVSEANLAAEAAALLRREPPLTSGDRKARLLHVRALYESDDFAGIEWVVGQMTEPVEPMVRAIAADAAASREDWDLAEALYAEVLKALDEKETDARGTALRGLGYVLGQRGRLPQAEQTLRQVLPLLEEARNERVYSEALGELAEVLSECGRFSEARQCLQRCREITARTGYLTALGVIEGQFGRVAVDAGDWPEAEAHLRAAMQIHEQVGNRWRRAWTHQQLARVQAATGRNAEANASHAAAAELYAELGVGGGANSAAHP